MQGARGDTLKQIQNALHLSSCDHEEIVNLFEDYLSKLTSKKSRNTNRSQSTSSILSNANCLYVMAGYTIKKGVKDVLSRFNFDIQSLDFARSEDSALTINSYVEQQTKSKIKKIADPSMLDESTRLVIVNAIYFKADWEQEFYKERSCKKDFYIDGTEFIQIDYMNHIDRFMFAFLEDINAKVLQLEYKSVPFNFIIILPNERTGLSALESNLQNYDLKQIISKLSERRVNATIPKFKVEFDLELNDVLQEVCSVYTFTV